MPVTDWIGEATRTKGRDDGFLVAIRTGVVNVGNIIHEIKAGITLWARYSPELRNPEVAALFGIRPTAVVVARSSPPARAPVRDYLAEVRISPARRGPIRDWLAPAPPRSTRDWLADDPKPKGITNSLSCRINYQQTDRLRKERP